MEKIHIETPGPLPSKKGELVDLTRTIVELGVPPVEIYEPILEDSISMEELPLTVLSCVKWKSKFQPNLWREEMERCLWEATNVSSWDMMETWQKLNEEKGRWYFDLDIRQSFEQTLRKRQAR
jgi:hypothetical protein